LRPCYNTPMWTILPIALLGWIFGAVANYLSDVLPSKRRITQPLCLACGASQSLINYLIFPRTCQQCGKRRSLRTWVVEVIYVLAITGIWFFPADHVNFWIGSLLLLYFGVVSIIDLEHRVILHPVSVVGVIIGAAIGISRHGIDRTINGGIVGFVIMLLLYYLGIFVVRIRNRGNNDPTLPEEALGFGDVNLSGVLGLLLGWPAILVGITITIFSAGAFSFVYLLVTLAAKRYHPTLAIPYGPFLVLGAIILLYF